ncbi:MAG: hypothetical protein ACAI44_03915 [Candidatus Sericytochromatia bacterium]
MAEVRTQKNCGLTTAFYAGRLYGLKKAVKLNKEEALITLRQFWAKHEKFFEEFFSGLAVPISAID